MEDFINRLSVDRTGAQPSGEGSSELGGSPTQQVASQHSASVPPALLNTQPVSHQELIPSQCVCPPSVHLVATPLPSLDAHTPSDPCEGNAGNRHTQTNPLIIFPSIIHPPIVARATCLHRTLQRRLRALTHASPKN